MYLLLNNEETYGTDRPGNHDNIIRNMRFACCLYKARDIDSEFVENIAFPRQKYLLNLAII